MAPSPPARGPHQGRRLVRLLHYPARYAAQSGTKFSTNNNQPNQIVFSFAAPITFQCAWLSLDAARNAHVQFEPYDDSGVKLATSAIQTQQLIPTFLSAPTVGVKKIVVLFDVDFAMDETTYSPQLGSVEASRYGSMGASQGQGGTLGVVPGRRS